MIKELPKFSSILLGPSKCKEQAEESWSKQMSKGLYYFSLEQTAKSKSLATVWIVQHNSPDMFLCCEHLSHVIPQFPLFAVRRMSKEERP